MGHYASEMTGHTPVDPDALRKRQQSAESSAQHVWDLYRRYEDEGVWIKNNEILTCPECFAEVRAILRASHEEWHSTL